MPGLGCQRTVLEPSSCQFARGVGDRQQRAKLAIGKRIADEECGARIAVFGQVVVARLHRTRDGESVEVERAAGPQVDGGAERAFFGFGRRGLAHRDVVEELRRESVEVEVATAVRAARRVGAAVGAHGFDAVDAHARELRAQAAHGNLPAFAGIARDHDARNALQRFGEVQIRKIGDVFGDDHVDRADLILLRFERFVEARAETGYHDFFDGLGAFGRVGGRGVLSRCAVGEAPDGGGRK